MEQRVVPPILFARSPTSPVTPTIEEQVVITKVPLVHIPEEILRPKAKTPFLAAHLDHVKIKQLSFLWRLSCDNFVNFRLACLFLSVRFYRAR